MPSTARPVNASTVSRQLTAAGHVTSHLDRRFRYDGIFVTKGVVGTVVVYLDLSVGARARAADRVTETLEGKGYAVERAEDNYRLTVSRPAPVAEPVADEQPVEAPALVRVVTSGRARLAHLAYGVHSATLCGRPTAGWSLESGAELPLCAVCSEHAPAVDEVDEQPVRLFRVGDRVTDLPGDRTGDVVRVGGPDEYGELNASVIWDGGDGIPRSYAESYLERIAADPTPPGAWAVESEAREDVQGGGFLWHLTHNGEPTHLSYGSRVYAVDAMLERNARDRTRDLKAKADAWGSDTLRLPALDAAVEQAQQRARGGHPGPARRTTSVRFTEAEYARIDHAITSGYADGLNAVLARLIDEHL